MTSNQKIIVVTAFSVGLLVSVLIGKWIVDTNQIPKKPFVIIKKECNGFNFMMCTYTFIDSTGTRFKTDEPSDKYYIGQTIK